MAEPVQDARAIDAEARARIFGSFMLPHLERIQHTYELSARAAVWPSVRSRSKAAGAACKAMVAILRDYLADTGTMAPNPSAEDDRFSSRRTADNIVLDEIPAFRKLGAFIAAHEVGKHGVVGPSPEVTAVAKLMLTNEPTSAGDLRSLAGFPRAHGFRSSVEILATVVGNRRTAK